MLNSRLIKAYLIPGLAFQSVIVAGGYATGREVVEFITSYGPIGGLLALIISAITFSVILGLTYEFSRAFKVYDYRNFFKSLLGKAWVGYEFVFLSTLLLILAVVSATAANVFSDNFNIPEYIGVILMLLMIVTTNYFGREVVNKTLTYCAVVLTFFIIAFFILVLIFHGSELLDTLGTGEVKQGWALSGFMFAAYNCTTIPALLFSAGAIQSKKESIGAGVIAAFLALIPGLLFHLSFLVGYPEVLTKPLPSYWLIAQLDIKYLLNCYIIILFVTLVQSGVGLLQGLIERIDSWKYEKSGKHLSHLSGAGISVITIVLASLLSAFGIIDLISKGYRGIAIGLFLVYLLPICTIGLYKIVRQGKQNKVAYVDK